MNNPSQVKAFTYRILYTVVENGSLKNWRDVNKVFRRKKSLKKKKKETKRFVKKNKLEGNLAAWR